MNLEKESKANTLVGTVCLDLRLCNSPTPHALSEWGQKHCHRERSAAISQLRFFIVSNEFHEFPFHRRNPDLRDRVQKSGGFETIFQQIGKVSFDQLAQLTVNILMDRAVFYLRPGRALKKT